MKWRPMSNHNPVVGDASLLKPGAAAAIVAVKKDAGLVATNLTAEKDGVKPR